MNILSKLRSNLIVILIGFFVLISSLIYLTFSETKIYFIDNQLLVKEFKMTKELERDYQSITTKRKELMDSLDLELKVLENKIRTGDNKLMDTYKYKLIDFKELSEEMEEKNSEVSAKFNDQVVTQLNQYVKEFAALHNVQFILGANGSGNLLYADEKYDKTKEVIVFVNKKYSGK